MKYTIICSLWGNLALYCESMECEVLLEWADYSSLNKRAMGGYCTDAESGWPRSTDIEVCSQPAGTPATSCASVYLISVYHMARRCWTKSYYSIHVRCQDFIWYHYVQCTELHSGVSYLSLPINSSFITILIIHDATFRVLEPQGGRGACASKFQKNQTSKCLFRLANKLRKKNR